MDDRRNLYRTAHAITARQVVKENDYDEIENVIRSLENIIDCLVYDEYFDIVDGKLTEYLELTALSSGPVSSETIQEILGTKKTSDIINEIMQDDRVSLIEENGNENR